MGSINAISRIDHVTILLSEEEFKSPPSWLSDNFTIIEGGKHTGKYRINLPVPTNRR
jgi:hypothetical protein